MRSTLDALVALANEEGRAITLDELMSCPEWSAPPGWRPLPTSWDPR
jgi:hypothetical protein